MLLLVPSGALFLMSEGPLYKFRCSSMRSRACTLWLHVRMSLARSYESTGHFLMSEVPLLWLRLSG